VFSTLYICWGAQAGLYHLYDVPKHPLPKKKFGIFAHKVLMPNQPLFRGYDDLFFAPHSRHTEVRAEDVGQNGRLQLLSASDEAGVYVVSGSEGRQIFVLGHPEYEADTLANENARYVLAGKTDRAVRTLFSRVCSEQKPYVDWRSHATLANKTLGWILKSSTRNSLRSE
jgi:homoserine O-succinyltransferase